MKIALVALLFAASAIAQDQPPNGLAACGSWNVSFHVKLDASPQTPADPESGKARVYFIQDSGTIHTFRYPSTRLGLDGKWAGVTRKNSYFSLSLDPGEHHVCAAEQTDIPWEHVELAHFVAEAGKVYYFLIRRPLSENGSTQYLELHLADSDEARYLIAYYPLSVSQVKK